MADSPLAPHSSSPADLKDQFEARRRGEAFLLYRDPNGRQRIHALGETASRTTVGRGGEAEVTLDWDEQVSRLHATLERLGDDWTVVDDGLSRNGTFCNGKRISGRQRLHDGDMLRFGRTNVAYCHTREDSRRETVVPDTTAEVQISPAQRRVLTALCRPYKGENAYAVPATNGHIAENEFLSIDVVKTHLRMLFRIFGIEHLPQNQKRARLVELAFKSGIIRDRDL